MCHRTIYAFLHRFKQNVRHPQKFLLSHSQHTWQQKINGTCWLTLKLLCVKSTPRTKGRTPVLAILVIYVDLCIDRMPTTITEHWLHSKEKKFFGKEWHYWMQCVLIIIPQRNVDLAVSCWTIKNCLLAHNNKYVCNRTNYLCIYYIMQLIWLRAQFRNVPKKNWHLMFTSRAAD